MIGRSRRCGRMIHCRWNFFFDAVNVMANRVVVAIVVADVREQQVFDIIERFVQVCVGSGE